METYNSSYKNRIIAYILGLGVMMFVILLYITYEDYQKKMGYQYKKLSTSLNSIIDTEEKRIVKLYQSRLTKNLKSYGVLDAIENNDNQKLYKLIKPRYEELIKESPYFKVMHFHTNTNHSFLRMHRAEKSGDDLSSIRQAVVDVNDEKKKLSGFELGVYGYYYRIISPIINKNNQHLGSVEFGLTLEYFLNNLKRLSPNTEFGLLIDKKIVSKDKYPKIQDYSLILDYNSFFTPNIDKIDTNKEYQVVDINDKTYIVSSNIYIKDYKGNDTIKILFAMDITNFKDELISDFLFLLIIGGITYFLSFILINTAFSKYIESIDEKTKELKKYLNIIEDHVILSSTDMKGNITYASDAFCKISGYSKKELLGHPHNLVRHQDMSKDVFKDLWHTIKEGRVWKGEFKNVRKDGTYYWVRAIISPTYDNNNKINGYTAIRTDITDKKTIEKLSQIDKLTQVYNRLKIDDVLEKTTHNAFTNKQTFSLILIDIDKFKSVNDTYGHQVGDSVLVDTAKILLQNIKKTDTLGRWGGEEFIIICPDTNKEGAIKLAQNLRKKLESHSFETVGQKTGSFGVTEYTQNDEISQMIKRADDALYEAKNTGRNKVVSI